MRGGPAAARVTWGHGLIAMSLLFFWAGASAAAPAVELNTELGIGGWVIPGTFTPLRVEVSAPQAVDGSLEVDVPALGRDPPLQHTHQVHLIPGVRAQVTFDVIIQDPRRPLVVRLRAGRAVIAQAEIPVGVLRTVEGVVAALTQEPAGLEFLSSGPRKLRPAYLREAALPTRWQSYAAVELLAIRDLDSRRLLPVQRQALVDWVAQGGRLLVTVRDGSALPPWLGALLPVEVAATGSVRVPPVPVPVARLLPKPGAATVLQAGALPVAVRGRYGRGLVEVWAFDAFAPSARVWPGQQSLWRSLLEEPRITPLAREAIAAELPQTRPLPGSTQAVLALLLVLYILAVRAVTRRWGGHRGGWAGLLATVALFAVVLFTFAAGARAAATTVVQVSVVETLPGAQRARVTSYASLITPYGGEFALHLPMQAVVRPLHPTAIRIVESERAVAGRAVSGHLMLEVTQVTPLEARVRIRPLGNAVALTAETPALTPRDAVLYRSRQLYRLGEGAMPAQVILDPARWVQVDRPGVLGTDVAGRAMAWLFGQLDRAPGAELWLLALVTDERLVLRLAGGRAAQATQILVVPVPPP